MKVLVIMGATATGKSGLALELAERSGKEIISADSRQVYQGLRIGTAQPSKDDRARVPHHLVDFLPLTETWSAQQFADATLSLIRSASGTTPILVGGTGFWIRSLIEGLFPLDLPRETTLAARAALEPLETSALYARLELEDSESANRLHHNDRQRIMRALEVLDATGITLSAHHQNTRNKPHEITWVRVVLTCPRAELHKRIETRLDTMLEGGWPEEVSSLINADVSARSPGMQALGYPEIVNMLRGSMSPEKARERILFRTRQYARRQEIWFRKEKDAVVLDAGQPDTPTKLEAMLKS